MTKAPKVFVSYSHDSPEHKQWVLDLATRLMKDGVDVTLDLWGLKPGADLPHFMETNLVSAEKVLLVCTDEYVRKANSGKGGVGYEKMIVTADLLKDIEDSKLIPLIRQGGTTNRPTFVRSKVFINLSGENIEFGYDELVRTLHNAPLYVKPEIGQRPTFDAPAPPSIPVEKRGDPVLAVMKIAVEHFEANVHDDYADYASLATAAKKSGLSRLYFDGVLGEVVAMDLLASSDGDFYELTDQGRQYAFKHRLVE